MAARARPPSPLPAPRRKNAERLARQPHWIERAVESGQIACYADVARALGLTPSRITQITALIGLSPALQEKILRAEGGIGIRVAIREGRKSDWERQSV